MNETRQGQIALTLVRYKLRKEGFRPNELRRELPNTAKDTGISVKELLDFSEILIREMVEETFTRE